MRNPNGHPLLASLIDWTMAPLQRVRERLVPDARGRVLEIGFGTGLNLAHYDFEAVEALTAIEPDPHMRARAERKIAAAGQEVTLVPAFAESLPFEDGLFDEVVLTFTLCTIPDPVGALAEVHRVLTPGGVLHFAEHTASDHGAMRSLQSVLDPVWSHFAGGCHLDRDAARLIAEAGFELEELHGHGRGPLNVTPVHRGRARRVSSRGTPSSQ
ncbi:MAG: methyltransferase domain-containing protein [Myxococcota bacterium]